MNKNKVFDWSSIPSQHCNRSIRSSQTASIVAIMIAIKPGAVSAVATAEPVADLTAFIKPFTPDALANGFATLIGALIGAMLAYLLQRQFQKSIDYKNAHMAAHRLMFALLQQINTIVLIQRDYIFEHLSNPARFISIPATPLYDTSKNVLQLPELTFLLDTCEGRSILYEFYIAQENYIEALNQWNLRSTLHLERVQPALAASTIPNGATVFADAIQDALGTHTFGSIVNSTDNCIHSLKRAFEMLAKIKLKARGYVVRRFKTNDFTDFDFPDTYGLSELRDSTR
ncbi:MAG: hypothetical protein PHC94_12850 [Methylobacter sp.]|nr:hypothetical protein [Methylobacter sp.]